MGWSFIVVIIAIGLVLLAIEIFVLPGTTIAAVAGALVLVFGIFMCYKELGMEAGHKALAASVGLCVLMLIAGYKFLGSRGMALDTDLSESKNYELGRELGLPVHVGEKGVAFGDIRPFGKAIINSVTYEVKSEGDFIPDNAELEVVEVRANRIVVKHI